MKLMILHLSDIHFREDRNSVASRATEIAAAAASVEMLPDGLLLVISGDVAFSGRADEYAAAQKFVTELQNKIAASSIPLLRTVVVPGNHDCDMSANASVRNMLIAGVSRQPEADVDDPVLEELLKPQSAFAKFAATVVSGSPKVNTG